MPPEGSEPSRMEAAHRGDVASHGPDGQVLVTTGTGFLDNPGDEQAANALVPSRLGDDDRLDFCALTAVEQAGQTDDPPVGLGHPGSQPPRIGENMRIALADAGASVPDVLSTRVLVATSRQEDLAAAWEVVRDSFGEHDVPSTLMGVTVLGYQDQLVEIEAVAAVLDS
jgi:enamine deaminase RidA (YjgF/YER057c/UK114 family)